MPFNSILVADLRCPSCHQLLFDRFVFCWGLSGELYRDPDREIRWARSSDGELVPPFVLVSGQINMGQPSLEPAWLSDQDSFDPEFGPYKCPNCGLRLEGVVAQVINGQLTHPVVLAEGDSRKMFGRPSKQLPHAFTADEMHPLYDIDAAVHGTDFGDE